MRRSCLIEPTPLVVSNLIDLAGNRFASEPLTASFSTLDTIGPVVASLKLNGPAVAGAAVPVEAILSEPEAGASVRFLKEVEPVAVATTNPYIAYITMPTNGSVRLQAIATDQFGNDGEITQLEVTVVSNTPPMVTLIRMDPTNGPVGTSKTLSFQLSGEDDNAVTNITLVGFRRCPNRSNIRFRQSNQPDIYGGCDESSLNVPAIPRPIH